MANQGPSTVGRYAITRLLGTGGMGAVYLATDPVIGRQVAIKLLHTTFDSPDARKRFQREIRATGALHHPNIVTIFDAGEHEGMPFIAMEYLQGASLDDLLRGAPRVTLQQCLLLMQQLCAGLGHAHAAGVIHRDVKPANLMVDGQTTLKILDFGIARLVEGGRTQLTMVGTPNYMSPEQIDNRHVDHRTDLFSAGAVFYEMLSGRQAFTGNNAYLVYHRVQSYDPDPLVERCPDLDPRVIAIVEKALRKNPDDRFASAAEMQAEITTVLEGVQTVAARRKTSPGIETVQTGRTPFPPRGDAAGVTPGQVVQDETSATGRQRRRLSTIRPMPVPEPEPTEKQRRSYLLVGAVALSLVLLVAWAVFGRGSSPAAAGPSGRPPVAGALAVPASQAATGLDGLSREAVRDRLGPPAAVESHADGTETWRYERPTKLTITFKDGRAAVARP